MSRKKSAEPSRRATSQVAAIPWYKRRRRLVVLACLFLVLPLTWWQWQAWSARTLCQQARQLLETNPRKAAELAEEAVSLSYGNFPEAQVIWTRSLVRSGQLMEAIGCFSLVTHPERTDHAELLMLAKEAHDSGVTMLEITALNAIPISSPLRSDAIERLIEHSQRFGRLEAALELAQELSRLRPQDPNPLIRIGELREQLMDPLQAVTAYEKALAINHDAGSAAESRLSALRSLVRLQVILGERESARRYQDELNALGGPRSAGDRLQESLLWRMEGSQQAAWNEVTALLAERPLEPAALELRGTLAMDRRDWATAECDFQGLVARQPFNKNAHYRLGLTLQHLGRAEEARKHFEINRRLTETSLKILRIRSAADASSVDRLKELQAAYEEIGQYSLAEAIGRQIQAAETKKQDPSIR